MAKVVPFKCWRPSEEIAAEVAALPYDTFSLQEAAAEIAAHPLSFLRIDKPAALFDGKVDEYDQSVYACARTQLDTWFEEGVFVPDNASKVPIFLVYRLRQGAHCQTGLIACASTDDYKNGVIKRHECTRMHKEQDRVDHITALEAHTGPVLLTYPGREELDILIEKVVQAAKPLYDFVAPDEVQHQLWRVDDKSTVQRISSAFTRVPSLYIADGHHRAAAAARVAESHADQGNFEARSFLVALFSSRELRILDYNRVISSLGKMCPRELIEAIARVMTLEEKGTTPYRPQCKGEVGMYIDGHWYKLSLPEDLRPDDVVEGLDVAMLHSKILEPLLQIHDPRSDPRISYVGGIRGLEELEERAAKTGGVAFALYPCLLQELFAVADAGRLMPPKSTWFEPKPRSGLAIHRIEPRPQAVAAGQV